MSSHTDDPKFGSLGELDRNVERTGYHSAKHWDEMGLDRTHANNAPPTSVVSDGEDLCKNGGVLKRVLREGFEDVRHAFPGKGAFVQMHYVGSRMDGVVFDKSCNFNFRDKAKQTFGFRLGEKEVIKGWEHGVATMNQGEVAVLILRSDYAYGVTGERAQDEDGIPGNATLRFEVELVGWEGGSSRAPIKLRSSMCALL